ncbi:MAG: efflux RND transporter periplasmic adaptor subunit [Gammaproteobacteria bacterium]|nr:efflux RND transporter periplasmic adaptor subunit [Gammaproteobacteria bacterium]
MLNKNKLRNIATTSMIGITLIATSACSDKKDETNKVKKPPISIITTSTAMQESLQRVVTSIGVINSVSAPTISAQSGGTVSHLHKDIGQFVSKNEVIAVINSDIAKLSVKEAEAAVKRLNALLQNQEKSLLRNKKLLKKGFISSARFEDIESQLKATREQYAQAQAGLGKAYDYLDKTSIRSPVAGNIIQRYISVGDFVNPGKPVFKISNSDKFQVVLLFPETTSRYFKKGLSVKLSSPATPGVIANGQITDVVSMIDTTNRSIRIVVDVNNPGGWYPGASVVGNVVLEEKPNAITVPQQSVILRPAGKVVYVVVDNLVKQRIIETGMQKSGRVEIISGLQVGEVIAQDGAPFLTDNTAVSIQEAN